MASEGTQPFKEQEGEPVSLKQGLFKKARATVLALLQSCENVPQTRVQLCALAREQNLFDLTYVTLDADNSNLFCKVKDVPKQISIYRRFARSRQCRHLHHRHLCK